MRDFRFNRKDGRRSNRESRKVKTLTRGRTTMMSLLGREGSETSSLQDRGRDLGNTTLKESSSWSETSLQENSVSRCKGWTFNVGRKKLTSLFRTGVGESRR